MFQATVLKSGDRLGDGKLQNLSTVLPKLCQLGKKIQGHEVWLEL